MRAGYRAGFATPVVTALLLANLSVFLLELASPGPWLRLFALWPLDLSHAPQALPFRGSFAPWQLVSYAFLHGGLMHLLFNMYALWLFGSRMEQVWGARRFTLYYFTCVVGAGVTQLLVASLSGGAYPTIGASGGVFGLLLAFGLTFPNERLLLVFPPVILKAKWFVLLYGVLELWLGVTGSEAGVAHFAHLGGMLFGGLLLYRWHARP